MQRLLFILSGLGWATVKEIIKKLKLKKKHMCDVIIMRELGFQSSKVNRVFLDQPFRMFIIREMCFCKCSHVTKSPGSDQTLRRACSLCPSLSRVFRDDVAYDDHIIWNVISACKTDQWQEAVDWFRSEYQQLLSEGAVTIYYYQSGWFQLSVIFRQQQSVQGDRETAGGKCSCHTSQWRPKKQNQKHVGSAISYTYEGCSICIVLHVTNTK